MAILTVAEIDRSSGLTPSLVAANGGGDSFANDGRTFFYVKNGGVAPITVTIDVAKTVDGQAPADKQFTVNNAAEKLIGPFPPSVYNDANGRVGVTYSGVTSVTVQAIRLPS